MKNYLVLLVLILSGCVGMQTYKGVVIQYSDVTENTNGTYSIEVLGHTDLSNDDMVDLVRLKAVELCKSNDVKIESFEMGTYGSHSQFGSVYPPKINGIVRCG